MHYLQTFAKGYKSYITPFGLILQYRLARHFLAVFFKKHRIGLEALRHGEGLSFEGLELGLEGLVAAELG